MNKFVEAEIKSREIFSKILENSPFVQDVKFTELYEHYDVKFTNIDGTINVAELKYRPNYSSTDKFIVNEGVLLEKFKYDSFMNQEISATHWYIMLFNDGVGYMFNLKNIKPEWQDKVLPKTSAVKSETKIKIVANIPLEEGIRFTY